MNTPQPTGLRFVTCMTCEATVIQHLDDHDAWRPKPPLCDACKAEGARQAAEWARQAHPVCPDCGHELRTPAEVVRFAALGADVDLCYDCAAKRVRVAR
mgnify:FL=1